MKQIREITHPGSNRARLWPQAGGPSPETQTSELRIVPAAPSEQVLRQVCPPGSGLPWWCLSPACSLHASLQPSSPSDILGT